MLVHQLRVHWDYMKRKRGNKFAFWISDEERAALIELARIHDMTPSAVLRRLVKSAAKRTVKAQVAA